MQKDEAQAQNPPSGVFIDYYLKAPASAPVTLEILDSTGSSARKFSSDPAAQQPVGGGRGARGGGGGIPNVSPLWQQGPPTPISGAAGMHRVSWNPVTGGGGRFGGGGGRGGGTVLTGTFTAKLTVGGQTYSQTFVVKPDPRIRVG
jgi:hypothetical protein